MSGLFGMAPDVEKLGNEYGMLRGPTRRDAGAFSAPPRRYGQEPANESVRDTARQIQRLSQRFSVLQDLITDPPSSSARSIYQYQGNDDSWRREAESIMNELAALVREPGQLASGGLNPQAQTSLPARRGRPTY